jgi:enamine deaminase RidA (YjgF/YER057c/UK114 family)
MAMNLAAQRECHDCSQHDGICNGDVVVITTSQSREIFVRCGPMIATGTPHEQASKFYRCLPRVLDEVGAEMGDVFLERVFFRDIETDFDTFAKIRLEAYRQAGVIGQKLPATSYINQPPCQAGQAFEMQIQAVVPLGGKNVSIESFPEIEPRVTQKVVQIGAHRHLYIMNIGGAGPDGVIPENFRDQADQMFDKSVPMLRAHGGKFSDVLRTWCYLAEIDRDYDQFNQSRNVFFEQHQVNRLPASTGIRAQLYPRGALCSFDLYSLLNPEGVPIEIMHTPTLNEADDYGSAFSRGMKVVLPEKTVLYISGTASIDERGDTVHLEDIEKQLQRMLLNVQELLKPHGSSFTDMVQVMTYLKRPSDYPIFRAIWDQWGLASLPNSVVDAGVCRPELLCEMEGIAIIPA